VHVCFGYAALVKGRPQEGYAFLAELAETPVHQVSIETAQSGLDCAVLEQLEGKTIILGVLDLSTLDVDPPEVVAARIRRALPYVPAERLVLAPDCGMKYLSRTSAFGKLEALVEGARIVRRELEAARDNSAPAQQGRGTGRALT
jgi:5-methyltetrahydropteroyltriglutamate--homocysteine methyltransferase